MRIGQLARRLGIPPSDILGFLANNNIETESGANSRLEETAVSMIIRHFAPEKMSEPLEEPADEVVEEPTPSVDETAVPEAPPEVIRVTKVELQGLKVLGKIELPGKKKVEEQESTPVPEGTESPERPERTERPERAPRREFQKRDNRRDSREWKNPLEQKRQREAREAEEKKREQAERLKEKRTNHYYNKVKSVPTKAVRKVEEQTVVEELETKEPPKTIIGKFLRWLRT